MLERAEQPAAVLVVLVQETLKALAQVLMPLQIEAVAVAVVLEAQVLYKLAVTVALVS